MGRSQETFGKKEREKKKRKKAEEKAKRREERKENPVGMSDNITYVDEFGQFHDTPPEPAKKVKAKNIVLGVPSSEGFEEDPVRQGTVTFFNHEKGYGFIKDAESSEGVFVHINNVTEEIAEGNKVEFETEKGPKGLSAVKVKVVR